jgi:hypothetical protein
LDLVATGFDKPWDSFGHTIRSNDDLLAAAAAFKGQFLQVCKPQAVLCLAGLLVLNCSAAGHMHTTKMCRLGAFQI